MHVRGAFTLPFLFAAALPSFSQDKPDPAEAHIRMHKRIAPSVVFVTHGNTKGTGVIIDKEGIVLTSPTACGQHTTDVTVQLPGHKRVNGKVIGRVNELELVLLKIDGKDLPAVELGDSDQVKPGALTYVFGDSFQSIERDDQVAISVGVLSSTYDVKSKKSNALYTGPVLETSCAVNQNQDGGPLVDARGRMIGMVTLNYDDSKFAGIAIPINTLKPEIQKILRQHRGIVDSPSPDKTGTGTPGWLGASIEEGDDSIGLNVTRLFKNGPAEKGGLHKGDVIKHVNRMRVITRRRFEEIMGTLEAGAVVTFRVERDGKEVDVVVTLGKKAYY